MPSPHLEKLGSPAHRKSPRKEKEADNAPKAQKAFKYQYNTVPQAEDETWSRTECSVLVAHKAFQEGGMRYCYKMYEIGIDGQYAPGVAKIFKPEVSDDEEVRQPALSRCSLAVAPAVKHRNVGESLMQRFNGSSHICLNESDLVASFAGAHQSILRRGHDSNCSGLLCKAVQPSSPRDSQDPAMPFSASPSSASHRSGSHSGVC
eukprot:3883398-Rhodomonas_salina.2